MGVRVCQHVLLCAALALPFGGCSSERSAEESGFTRPTEDDLASSGSSAAATDEPRRPTSKVATVDGGLRRSAPGDAAPAAGDGGSGDAAPTSGDGAPTSSLSPQARAMADSLQEAVSSLSSDRCEQSFNTLKALARAANRAVPRRADYLQACGELSPAMQSCLLPAYREDHQVECESARSQTDNATLRRLREVIEGHPE